MLNLGAARERMQGTAATALGLAAIVLLFVYLVPRQGEIAAAMNALHAASRARAEAEAERSAPPAPAAAEVSAPASQPATAIVEEPAPASASAPPPAEQASAAPEAASPAAEHGSQLLARPVVLDTATILVRQGRVRLAGIKAAPLAKKCGEEGPRGWFCGVEARTRFRSFLRARSIRCDVPAGFGAKAEEVEARCDLGGEDLGNWLVANGYAEAAAGGSYAGTQAKAKAAKLGIWAETRGAD